MGIIVERAGLQTTLQGRPRIGWRHRGIPRSGPADSLSMALANRLVGKPSYDTALELTLTGCRLRFGAAMAFAVTGPSASINLSGQHIDAHKTYYAEVEDILDISAPHYGCRNYIAVSDSIEADDVFESTSTYLPAAFGGYGGRALKDGDAIGTRSRSFRDSMTTPSDLIMPIGGTMAIQVCEGHDYEMLDSASQSKLLREPYTISNRSSRMGMELLGQPLTITSKTTLDSAAVFPGTVQCPPSGTPFLLSVDSQTTGGYPVVLQVIRSDLHLIGQLRPGMKVQFLRRSPEQARANLTIKQRALSEWLPDYWF